MSEPQRLYFSYNQIHETIRASVVGRKLFVDFKSTLIISIGECRANMSSDIRTQQWTFEYVRNNM
jgi:hypothetical protein